MNKNITSTIEKQADHIEAHPRVDPRCPASCKKRADSSSSEEKGVRTHCIYVHKHTKQKR